MHCLKKELSQLTFSNCPHMYFYLRWLFNLYCNFPDGFSFLCENGFIDRKCLFPTEVIFVVKGLTWHIFCLKNKKDRAHTTAIIKSSRTDLVSIAKNGQFESRMFICMATQIHLQLLTQTLNSVLPGSGSLSMVVKQYLYL